MANWVKKPRGHYEVELIRDQMVTENPKQLYYLVKWKNWSDASNEWFPAEELEKTAPLIVSDWKKQREMDSDLEETSESEDNQENAEEASNPEENDVDEASCAEDNHEDDDEDEDDCFDPMPVRKVSEVEMESLIEELGAAVDKDYKQMLDVASNGNELLDPDAFEEKCKMKVLKDQVSLFNKKLSIQRRRAVEKREEQAEGFKILAGVVKEVLQLDTEITQANLHLCLPDIHEKVEEVKEKLSQVKKFKTIQEQMNKI